MAAKRKSAEIDRKKLFSDPVMIGMIVVLLVFLILFISFICLINRQRFLRRQVFTGCIQKSPEYGQI